MVFYINEGINVETSKKIARFVSDLKSYLKNAAKLVRDKKAANLKKFGILYEDSERSDGIESTLYVYVNSPELRCFKSDVFYDSFIIKFVAYKRDHVGSKNHYNLNSEDITIRTSNPSLIIDPDEINFIWSEFNTTLYHELAHKLDMYIDPSKYYSYSGKNTDYSKYTNQRTELFAFYNEILSDLIVVCDKEITSLFKNIGASDKKIAQALKYEIGRNNKFWDTYLTDNFTLKTLKRFLDQFLYIIETKMLRTGWKLNEENRKAFIKKATKDYPTLKKDFQKKLEEKIRRLT